MERKKRFEISNHNKLIYPNLLKQAFDVDDPNATWVSDITYIWTCEDWLYLAGVKDLYTKEVVGYGLNKRMAAALLKAVDKARPKLIAN